MWAGITDRAFTYHSLNGSVSFCCWSPISYSYQGSLLHKRRYLRRGVCHPGEFSRRKKSRFLLPNLHSREGYASLNLRCGASNSFTLGRARRYRVWRTACYNFVWRSFWAPLIKMAPLWLAAPPLPLLKSPQVPPLFFASTSAFILPMGRGVDSHSPDVAQTRLKSSPLNILSPFIPSAIPLHLVTPTFSCFHFQLKRAWNFPLISPHLPPSPA